MIKRFFISLFSILIIAQIGLAGELPQFNITDFAGTFTMIDIGTEKDINYNEIYFWDSIGDLQIKPDGNLSWTSYDNDMTVDSGSDTIAVFPDGTFTLKEYPQVLGHISANKNLFIIDILDADSERISSEFMLGARNNEKKTWSESDLSGNYTLTIISFEKSVYKYAPKPGKHYKKMAFGYTDYYGYAQTGIITFDGSGNFSFNTMDQDGYSDNGSGTYSVSPGGKFIVSDTSGYSQTFIEGMIAETGALFFGVERGDSDFVSLFYGIKEPVKPLSNRDLLGTFYLGGLNFITDPYYEYAPEPKNSPYLDNFDTDLMPVLTDFVIVSMDGTDTITIDNKFMIENYFQDNNNDTDKPEQIERDTYIITNSPVNGSFSAGYDTYSSKYNILGAISPDRNFFSISQLNPYFPGVMFGIRAPMQLPPKPFDPTTDTYVLFDMGTDKIDRLSLNFDTNVFKDSFSVSAEVLGDSDMENKYTIPTEVCKILGGFDLLFDTIIETPEAISIVYTYTDTAIRELNINENTLKPYVYSSPDNPEEVVAFEVFPDENKVVITTPHFSSFIIGAAGQVADLGGAGSSCIIEKYFPSNSVEFLRNLRDVLLNTGIGRKLSDIYYH